MSWNNSETLGEMENENKREGFSCFVCSVFVPGNYANLTKHFKIKHLFKTSNHVHQLLICAQNGCKEKFQTFANFKYHLSVCEKVVGVRNIRPRAKEWGCYSNLESLNNINIPEVVLDEQKSTTTEAPPPEIDPITKSLAFMTLKLKSHFNVSQSATDFIVDILKKTLHDIASVEPVDFQVSKLIRSLILLDSQYKRDRYYETALSLKPPTEISLNQTRQENRAIRKEPGARIPRLVPLTFQYFPLRNTLSLLFSNTTFRKLYFGEKKSQDSFIRGHRDSLHFTNHPLFTQDQFALRLAIFFDEVEMVSPLGSKTKKHDQGMFLFQIHNMPPSWNSRLSSIFPFANCNGSHVREFGFDGILKLLMEELKLLESESGMLLNVSDMPGFRLRGSIICVCADSKAAHELGGFMSCSAEKFCRLCLLSRAEILSCREVDRTLLRNRENYLLGVNRAKALGDGDSSTGIQRDCLLNQSRYYHVADAENQVMDAFHDFLEGTVSFVTKIVLRNFVLQGKMDASLLNRRIKNFQYSQNDLANKPSPRFTDVALRQKGNYNTKQRGAQNWCLARMLPLLIGDLVERGDKHFALLLNLLDIMDIIFCPAVSPAHPAILKHLIAQISERLALLYPDLIPPNKWHHMAHYVTILKMFGPVMRYACMRFEGFLNIPKRKAQTNFNFKNFSKSLGYHLAAVLCTNLLDDDTFDINRLFFGPCESFGVDEIATKFSIVGLDNYFIVDDPVSITDWVSLNGLKYQKQNVVLVKSSYESENGLPIFAEIQNIFVQNDTAVVSAVILITENFDEHFHAYEVKRNNLNPQNILHKLNANADCEPLTLLKGFSQGVTLYVAPRHSI